MILLLLTILLTILLNKKVNIKSDLNKEELIKSTAKDIFFNKGNLHATTQEIADEACINRSLINYYFRSRDVLFQTVYHEAVDNLRTQLNKVLSSKLPFREKIEQFIDAYMTETIKFPYRESFLITEICSKNFALKEKKKSPTIISFLNEIQQQVDKGLIKKIEPIHFMLNLFSLMAYPVIMAPLYKKIFDINNEKYAELISERKQIILQTIFN